MKKTYIERQNLMRNHSLILILLLGLFFQSLHAIKSGSVCPLTTPRCTFAADTLTLPRKISMKQAFNEEFTLIGVGLVVAGFVARDHKREYQSIRSHSMPNFQKKYDDYTQYSPAVATYLLKMAGVENRSSWSRMITSNVLSAATMALVVNTMKNSIDEMRPDGSSANSFPSGHTATAFVSATILHKEYGAKSPWYSVAGYTMATATGVSRLLNNRHWISDVLVGAGIGILSTDLGYFFGDLLFKEKGIKQANNNSNQIDISENPSFISFGVQVGMETSYLNAPKVYDNYDADLNPTAGANSLNMRLKLGISSSISVEGACFFNKHWGVGGRIRATATPVLSEISPEEGFNYGIEGNKLLAGATNIRGLESGHLSMFELSLGGYYSYPIGERMILGTKLLIGNRVTTNYELSAIYNAPKEASEKEFIVDPKFLVIDAEHSPIFNTGLSFTYAHKHGMAFRLSLDYDTSSPEYVYKLYNRFDKKNGTIEDVFKKQTNLNHFNAGLSMSIHF